MKSDRRGSWYLLTGLVLGVAVGLMYSWQISPVRYVDAPPYALSAEYKDDYRALIASAYLYSNDLLRADARLAELKDENPQQELTLQAQRALAEGRSNEEIQALRSLAQALLILAPQNNEEITPELLSTSISNLEVSIRTPIIAPPATIFTATATPRSVLLQIKTNTPQPTQTATATPTPGAPFILQETHMVCDVRQPDPLIEVEVRDASGSPVPSVEVLVTWQGGADHFFTGLQPELGMGYGDFSMLPEVVYAIQLVYGGPPAENLTASECVAEDGSTYWGSWYLVFIQPS